MVVVVGSGSAAMFDGSQARRAGDARTVPTEYSEAAEWWFRGWDRVDYLIENNLETEDEREAQDKQ
tara:strand:+ start:328 stop:525 length:198 start_codon:yes stop_codon:yes gene_type:complete